MASASPPGPTSIPLLAGPSFLGILLNNYLFGILTIQYYNYHVYFQNDYPLLRAIVHIQFFLEAAQTAMSIADGFHWFVYGFGNLEMLGEFFLSTIDSPIFCGVIAFISQAAYCWRIYHLSSQKIMAFIITLIACGAAAGAFGVGIVNRQLGTLAKWNNNSSLFVEIWVICSAVCDIMIAIVMPRLLLSSKSANKSQRSQVASRVVRLVVATNVLTAIVALTLLVTVVVGPIKPPKAGLFYCPAYVLAKLYSIAFVTMLNSRQYAGGLVENIGVHVEEVAKARRGINHRGPRPQIIPAPAIEGIAVVTETAVRLDARDQTVAESKYNMKTLGFVLDM